MCPRRHDGLLDSLFFVWLQCASVAHVEQGYVSFGDACVFAVRRFQCVACPSPIGCFSVLHFLVRVRVCCLRGVPCGELLRVAVWRKQYFVLTFESSPAVDLSC